MLPSLIFELINNIKAKYSKLEMEKGIIRQRKTNTIWFHLYVKSKKYKINKTKQTQIHWNRDQKMVTRREGVEEGWKVEGKYSQ